MGLLIWPSWGRTLLLVILSEAIPCRIHGTMKTVTCPWVGFSLDVPLCIYLPQHLGVLLDRAVPLKRCPKERLLSAVTNNWSKHACDVCIMSGALRPRAVNAQLLPLTGVTPLIAGKRHFCLWVSCCAHVEQSLIGVTLCACALDNGCNPQRFLLARGVIQGCRVMKLMARMLWFY